MIILAKRDGLLKERCTTNEPYRNASQTFPSSAVEHVLIEACGVNLQMQLSC